MKLNIVPAKVGLQWVKLGIKTFLKQPLALAGLFVMFFAAMSVLSLLPLIGGLMALVLLPASTLGLMAATKEASKGKFPMPTILITAFRTSQQQIKAMLILGAVYALGFLLIMGVSTLFDGGKFARLALMGGTLTRETVMEPDFQSAAWASLGLNIPLSMLFWHAPALVHWYGVAPMKSLFFSFVACIRNFGSYALFSLGWIGVFMGLVFAVTAVTTLTGGPTAASAAMFPTILLIGAMFFTSIYFTFESTFQLDDKTPSGNTP